VNPTGAHSMRGAFFALLLGCALLASAFIPGR
jgi:hypothetical protein